MMQGEHYGFSMPRPPQKIKDNAVRDLLFPRGETMPRPFDLQYLRGVPSAGFFAALSVSFFSL